MVKRKDKNWIQRAKIKKGALHRQLAVTGDIPVSLLRKIKRSKTGTTISNPTKRKKKNCSHNALKKKS